MAKDKKIMTYIKLQVPAGAASPSPPVGPALGQHGVNLMDFCNAFNSKTNELEKNIKNIKKILKQFKFKNSVKILYGGSVNSKNANEISKIDGIGGLLVGGASLNSKKFVDIIKKTSN